MEPRWVSFLYPGVDLGLVSGSLLMHTYARKLRIAILSFILLGALAEFAHAEMVSTGELTAAAKIRADRDKIKVFLSRANAAQTLQAMGVEPQAAKQRVDALTDEEVETIAGKIDELPAGGALSGSDTRLLILIIAILAIVLIV